MRGDCCAPAAYEPAPSGWERMSSTAPARSAQAAMACHSSRVGIAASSSPSRHVGAYSTTGPSSGSAPQASATVARARTRRSSVVPRSSTSSRGSPETRMRAASSPNALRMRPATSADATGKSAICAPARRYSARMRRPTPGRDPMRGKRRAAAESRWSLLSGMPCHSCTTRAPLTPKRLTSPKPWVTTATPARSVAHRPRGPRLGRARMPRARAASSSARLDASHVSRRSGWRSRARSCSASAPSPRPAPEPSTHWRGLRGTRTATSAPSA